eukprot:4255378-Lingulodinium_polyedra.AAC.1
MLASARSGRSSTTCPRASAPLAIGRASRRRRGSTGSRSMHSTSWRGTSFHGPANRRWALSRASSSSTAMCWSPGG